MNDKPMLDKRGYQILTTKITNISKPKGEYLILCICGYPVYIRQMANRLEVDEAELEGLDELEDEDYEDYDEESDLSDLEEDEVKVRTDRYEDVEVAAIFKWTCDVSHTADSCDITGSCRNCSSKFLITTSKPYPIFMKHDSYWMRKTVYYGPYLFFNPMFLPDSEGLRVDVASPGSPQGFQSIYINSKAKRHFANAVERALKWGLQEDKLPIWHKQASDKQFDEWRKQIDNLVKTKGLIPM